MILGIDVGYSHTKVWGRNGEFSFKSTIQEDALDVFSGSIRIEYEGQEYTIGENNHNSLYDNEVNKIESLNFRLCLYTAIAKAMKENNEDIYLVTGLPGQYYKTQKDELIRELTNKKITITLNDEPKRFTIKNVIVFPQSAGVLLLNPEKLKGDTCVVDIGGFTVDISYFNNQKLQKLDTFEEGMNKVGYTLVQKIKSEHGVSYDMLKADDLFDSKEIVNNNKVVKIDDIIDDVLNKHTKLIENKLKGIPEYNFSKHVFIGGGAYRLAKYLNDKIEKETIYTNAKAYYLIGVNKFE